MNKITKILHACEDQEYGGIGFTLNNWPSNFNPAVTGDALAHDILEHIPNKDAELGSFEDELMALGARTFVRGEWNCYNPRSQSGYADAMADEVAFQIRSYNVDTVRECRKTVWGPIREMMPTYQDFVGMVKRKCNDEDCDFPGWRANDIRNIYRWLERGYRLAKNRYSGHHPGSLLSLVERFKKAYPHELKEYAEYELHVNINSGTVRIDEYYPED